MILSVSLPRKVQAEYKNMIVIIRTFGPWTVIRAECVTYHCSSCARAIECLSDAAACLWLSAEHQLWNATLLRSPRKEEILPGGLRHFLATQYDSHT
jgi:hypothetical protein